MATPLHARCAGLRRHVHLLHRPGEHLGRHHSDVGRSRLVRNDARHRVVVVLRRISADAGGRRVARRSFRREGGARRRRGAVVAVHDAHAAGRRARVHGSADRARRHGHGRRRELPCPLYAARALDPDRRTRALDGAEQQRHSARHRVCAGRHADRRGAARLAMGVLSVRRRRHRLVCGVAVDHRSVTRSAPAHQRGGTRTHPVAGDTGGRTAAPRRRLPRFSSIRPCGRSWSRTSATTGRCTCC